MITVHARADMMFVPDFMVLFNSSADSSLDPPPSPPGDGVLPTLNLNPEESRIGNLIQPIVVEILQSGTKCWSSRQSDSSVPGPHANANANANANSVAKRGSPLYTSPDSTLASSVLI